MKCLNNFTLSLSFVSEAWRSDGPGVRAYTWFRPPRIGSRLPTPACPALVHRDGFRPKFRLPLDFYKRSLWLTQWHLGVQRSVSTQHQCLVIPGDVWTSPPGAQLLRPTAAGSSGKRGRLHPQPSGRVPSHPYAASLSVERFEVWGTGGRFDAVS